MKLIIDIPECLYEQMKNGKGEEYGIPNWLGYSIYKGTPLDDVKAEIQAKEVVETDIERQFYNMALDDVNKILDNIGKAEKGGE